MKRTPLLVVLAAIVGLTMTVAAMPASAATTAGTRTAPLTAITAGKQVKPGVYQGIYQGDARTQATFCTINYICLFQNPNANAVRGAYLAFQYQVPATQLEDLANVSCPPDTGCSNNDLNDDMSSFTNASPIQWCWMPDAHWQGTPRTMPPTGADHFINVAPADDNQASSAASCY
ncbi:peptidase inhibitor family I36 protein [Fodinicola acaciae]|uniref:peptidase inhibitor family I36 protein n=1 Tax=Fodinicola acaciae TaxID=2681555 RepID=UPI0013CF4715|nr:peptidase inhibitor family I36 protein [Fodinicola acaciae]